MAKKYNDLNDFEGEEWKDLTKRMESIFIKRSYAKDYTDDDVKKFIDISLVIHSLLPEVNDKSLFEVDDLLHCDADAKLMESASGKGTKVPDIWEIDKWIMMYSKIALSKKNSFESHSQVMEMTSLQIIEHSSIKTWFEFETFDIWFPMIEALLDAGNDFSICHAIKVLRLFVGTHGEEIRKVHQDRHASFEPYLFWMMKLKQLPQVNHPVKARIASWITKQSSMLLEELGHVCQTDSITYKSIQMYESLQGGVDSKILYEMFEELSSNITAVPKIVWFELVYKLFTSARDDNERLDRINFFCKFYSKYEADVDHALFMEFQENLVMMFLFGPPSPMTFDSNLMNKMANKGPPTPESDAMFKLLLDARDDEEKLNRVRAVYDNIYKVEAEGNTLVEKIVYGCIRNIAHITRYNWCTNDRLMEIHSAYRYDIKPYISEEGGVSENAVGQAVADSRSLECSSDESGSDFVLEKFFYDHFMKSVHLLSIIHFALRKGKELKLLKIESDEIAQIFITTDELMRSDIERCLKDSSRPWFAEVLKKFCPYVVVTAKRKKEMEDNFRILKVQK